MFANSADKHDKIVLNLFWPPCVMNINEVCMDWFYGIYKPANQIYGDLQTSNFNGIKWDAINTNLYKIIKQTKDFKNRQAGCQKKGEWLDAWRQTENFTWEEGVGLVRQ